MSDRHTHQPGKLTKSEGWWDKPDSGLSNIEIDVIGVDTDAERILFGSCKRSADKHTGASLAKSRAHIESFLSTKLGATYRRYEQIHYAFAPVIGVDRRHEISTHGFVPMDLLEFAQAVMTKKTFRNTTSYARNTFKVKIFTLGSKLLVMLN